MAVIALTSGIGTGSKHLAELVGKRLGLVLAYREISMGGNATSGVMNKCPAEPSAPRWERGLAALNNEGNGVGLTELEDIYRLAQRGNVLICGTSPLHFLADIEHVIKVRVRTTMALRVRRIMAFMNTDIAQPALGKILAGDQRQAAMLDRLFQIADLEDPSLYDLVVDTGREPVESIASQIVDLVTMPKFKPREEYILMLEHRATHVNSSRSTLLNWETNILTNSRQAPCTLNQPSFHIVKPNLNSC